jgi:hypothetical protein
MPTDEDVRTLVRTATDAAEELYVIAQVSRRPAVRERWQALLAALQPFGEQSSEQG